MQIVLYRWDMNSTTAEHFTSGTHLFELLMKDRVVHCVKHRGLVKQNKLYPTALVQGTLDVIMDTNHSSCSTVLPTIRGLQRFWEMVLLCELRVLMQWLSWGLGGAVGRASDLRLECPGIDSPYGHTVLGWTVNESQCKIVSSCAAGLHALWGSWHGIGVNRSNNYGVQSDITSETLILDYKICTLLNHLWH